MSAIIDERVVEMRFDNKQFKEGTQETLSLLDRLKKSLNLDDAAKSFDQLDKAANNVQLDGIAAAVDALQDRFSTFGIVGMRIIENITDALTGKLVSAVRFVSDSIVSGGIKRAMNIENAHFQLQALLKDEALVQQYMDAAMQSVDGTAYAYDEAAKAASQFAASGVQAGEEVLTALRGITGVAAMTNSDYEGIARIFNTIAGNGRLMGDQLLQLSSRGMNAAATIADYYREVEKQTDMTEATIRDMVSRGLISFDTFAKAMDWAFGESAFRANETFTGAFANMKSALARIGAGFFSPLVAQNSEVVRLFNVLRERINDVKKALVFDESIGNVNALSKQFTDTVLAMSSAVSDFLSTADLTKPLEIFYYGVEIVKNIAKGLYSVIKPIGRAFSEVFFSFSIDRVVNIVSVVEELTSKLKLSDKNAENLHDAFKGIFDIGKMVIKVFAGLLKIIFPMNGPVRSLTEWFLELVGAFGRALSKFAEWVSTSPKVAKAYEIVSKAVKATATAIINFIASVKNFVKQVKELPGVQKFLTGISGVFKELGRIAAPYVDLLVGRLKDFKSEMAEFIPEKAGELADGFLKKLNSLLEALSNINLSGPAEAVGKFIDAIKNLGKSGDEIGEGSGFISNIKSFFSNIKEVFTFDNLFDSIDRFKDRVGGFVSWIKQTLAPSFNEFSLGSTIAAGSGIGLIYAFIRMATAFENVTEAFTSVPKLLGAVRQAVAAYQDNIKADTVLKVAKAIAILAGSVILLSFVNEDKLTYAVLMLMGLSGFLMMVVVNILKASNRSKDIKEGLAGLADALGSGFKKIAKGIKWKLIGSAIKDMGIAILLVVGSIAAIALMYSKNQEAVKFALEVVFVIGVIIFAIIGLMATMDKKLNSNSKTFQQVGMAVALLAGSLYLVILSLNKLFKMTLPDDWGYKVGILAGILLGLTGITVVLAKTAKNSEGVKGSTTPLLALAASLYLAVLALDKLFKMDMGKDWGYKVGILAGFFVLFGGLIVILTTVTKKSGGMLKAGATIMAMAVFLVAVVGSLMILTMLKPEKLIPAAIVLAGVLISLGVALGLISRIGDTEKLNGIYKTVLAMGVVIVAISASLAILSLVPWKRLVVPALALITILAIIALVFSQIGKIKTEGVWKVVASVGAVLVAIMLSLLILSQIDPVRLIGPTIALGLLMLEMVYVMKQISKASGLKIGKGGAFALAGLVLLEIAASLAILSNFPIEGIIVSTIAMGALLFEYTKMMELISKKQGLKLDKIGAFVLGAAALLGIAVSISMIAGYPWQNILSAAAGLALVLGVYAKVFTTLNQIEFKLETIAILAAGVVALLGVAYTISKLAEYPWEGLIGSAVSIVAVLIGMAAAMLIASIAGKLGAQAVAVGIVGLESFIISFAAILAAIGALCQSDNAKNFVSTGADMLVFIGEAIGGFIGGIISGIGQGIADSLVNLGEGMVAFMASLQAFFLMASMIDDDSISKVGKIADMLLVLTAASILDGIGELISFGKGGIDDFGDKLAAFGEGFVKFCTVITDAGIDGASVEAAANAALALGLMAEAIPSENGLLAKITGTKDLGKFAEELQTFAPALVSFAELCAPITPGQVEGATQAAMLIANLAKELPKEGGIWQQVFGEQDIGSFGEKLLSFGKSLSEFVPYVEGITPEMVSGAVNAAQMMVDLANTLPKSDGVFQDFFGEQDIEAFGKKLLSFGKDLQEFVPYVSGISESDVSGAANAAQAMADVANTIPKSDGIFLNFFGSQDIGVFGEQLVSFGEGFYKFARRVKNIKAEDLDGVITSSEKLAVLASDLGSSGGILEFFTGRDDIGTFGTNLSTFGLGFKGFYDSVSEIDTEKLSSVIEEIGNIANIAKFAEEIDSKAFKNLSNNLILLAKTDIDGLIETFSGASDDLTDTIETLCKEMMKEFNDELSRDKFNTIVRTRMSSMSMTFNLQKIVVITAALSVANAILDTFRNTLTQEAFNQIGKDAVSGLSLGIESNISAASNSAAKAAKSIVSTTKKVLDSHSPSEVAFGIGVDWDTGLAGGITSGESEIKKSAVQTSRSLIDTTNKIVQAISDSIEENPDYTPTIVPVLDLSNLENSSQAIASYFKDGFAVSTYQNAIATSASMNRTKTIRDEREETSESLGSKFLDFLSKFKDGNFGTKVENTFYIQSDNTEEVADAVSKRIQREIERKSSVWG